MAEDEDGASNRKSLYNSENAGPSHENDQNSTKPDLGIEVTNYNITENGLSSPEPRSSTSKSNGATRKDENPFSFRHFLKRDLSLPGNSTYENTGARPKVYANTVQHSPTRLDLHSDTRRERDRPRDTSNFHTKDSETSSLRLSEAPSSGSVEIPLSDIDSARSTSSRHFKESDSFYHRPNLASEPLGMPSLPDFVQDHILVEQAYLNSNGPLSVDLDNLPDFTFNTNYNATSSGFPSGRRSNTEYGRNYGYDANIGAVSAEFGAPLDLPAGAEAAGPCTEPPHLNLDLTESVNPADRRNMSPRNNFDNPLDLPPNAGAEPMALPDFLPVRAGAAAGRTSPEPEEAHHAHHIANELERVRCELAMERARRCRAEDELQAHREAASLLRAEAASARASEAALLARVAHTDDGSEEGQLDEAASVAADTAVVAMLRKEIKQLKEQLNICRAEMRSLRHNQTAAASDLRQAASHADTQLRSLLSGIEQLRVLSAALDNT